MMTLEQVRDELRRPWNQTSAFAWCAQLADAIDFHISQPQPVAQGEAVTLDIEWPEFHQQGMGCGLEDRGITDRYEAMRYGWGEALNACAQAVDNATPAIPTDHRVVPVEPTEQMISDGCSMHVCEQGDSYYKSWELTEIDCVAIYKAMLAAAPYAGSVW